MARRWPDRMCAIQWKWIRERQMVPSYCGYARLSRIIPRKWILITVRFSQTFRFHRCFVSIALKIARNVSKCIQCRHPSIGFRLVSVVAIIAFVICIASHHFFKPSENVRRYYATYHNVMWAHWILDTSTRVECSRVKKYIYVDWWYERKTKAISSQTEVPPQVQWFKTFWYNPSGMQMKWNWKMSKMLLGMIVTDGTKSYENENYFRCANQITFRGHILWPAKLRLRTNINKKNVSNIEFRFWRSKYYSSFWISPVISI